MTNNQILRRLRYAFDFNDSTMIKIFGHAGLEVSRAQISDWLKKDDDAAFVVVGETGEEGHEAVVVGLRDGVAFVIMTARATDGYGKESFAGGAHDVVEDVEACLMAIDWFVVPLHESVVAGGDF